MPSVAVPSSKVKKRKILRPVKARGRNKHTSLVTIYITMDAEAADSSAISSSKICPLKSFMPLDKEHHNVL